MEAMAEMDREGTGGVGTTGGGSGPPERQRVTEGDSSGAQAVMLEEEIATLVMARTGS